MKNQKSRIMSVHLVSFLLNLFFKPLRPLVPDRIRIDSFWFFFCFLDEPTETEKETKSKPNSSFPHSARTFKQPNFEFYEFEWV